MVVGPIRNLSNRWDFNPPEGWKAGLLAFFYAVTICATAGVLIGYGQLYPVLVDAGVLSELCPGMHKVVDVLIDQVITQ